MRNEEKPTPDVVGGVTGQRYLERNAAVPGADLLVALGAATFADVAAQRTTAPLTDAQRLGVAE